MTATYEPPSLTAGDLMTRQIHTLCDTLPLDDAARAMVGWGARGVPVVDELSRCVGVLSVSHLTRWVANRDKLGAPLPQTCHFQEKHREAGGRETVRCLVEAGSCPFQRNQTTAEGCSQVVCTEPHSVPTDWQVVELTPTPLAVRDLMTTEVVSVRPDSLVPDLARWMLDRDVNRVFVLGPERHLVGVVSVDDLLQVLAHPEIVGARPGH